MHVLASKSRYFGHILSLFRCKILQVKLSSFLSRDDISTLKFHFLWICFESFFFASRPQLKLEKYRTSRSFVFIPFFMEMTDQNFKSSSTLLMDNGQTFQSCSDSKPTKS